MSDKIKIGFLDWVLFANMKRLRLPGTEHMEKEYHQKWFHVKVCMPMIPIFMAGGIVSSLLMIAIWQEKEGDFIQVLSQFHDLILCIISALEARDIYTSHHSSRVAEMTETICELMDLNEDEKEIYHIAAHLHDIGKIGIRNAVLLKEGKLNDEEWEIMKSHLEQGYNILMNARSFEVVADVVRSHHERYDGKGYSDGLKGADREKYRYYV